MGQAERANFDPLEVILVESEAPELDVLLRIVAPAPAGEFFVLLDQRLTALSLRVRLHIFGAAHPPRGRRPVVWHPVHLWLEVEL